MKIRSTTVLSVRRDGKVVVAGDGQVSLGNTVMKSNAKKVRRMHNDKVVAGWNGLAIAALAECGALFDRPDLVAAAQGVWALLRDVRLEAVLIVADPDKTFLLTGTGDIIEPEAGIVAIGSGGPYALAAARALAENTTLGAREIAERSLKIAGDICIYTNQNITVEEL